MTRLVLDASVILKWVFSEQLSEQARAILEGVRNGEIELLQPPHALAEAAAVATRLDPPIAARLIDLLFVMQIETRDDRDIYHDASDLAASLGHHSFDTLYHAVARDADATLITADHHYLRKARSIGNVQSLTNWPQPG